MQAVKRMTPPLALALAFVVTATAAAPAAATAVDGSRQLGDRDPACMEAGARASKQARRVYNLAQRITRARVRLRNAKAKLREAEGTAAEAEAEQRVRRRRRELRDLLRAHARAERRLKRVLDDLSRECS